MGHPGVVIRVLHGEAPLRDVPGKLSLEGRVLTCSAALWELTQGRSVAMRARGSGALAPEDILTAQELYSMGPCSCLVSNRVSCPSVQVGCDLSS